MGGGGLCSLAWETLKVRMRRKGGGGILGRGRVWRLLMQEQQSRKSPSRWSVETAGTGRWASRWGPALSPPSGWAVW